MFSKSLYCHCCCLNSLLASDKQPIMFSSSYNPSKLKVNLKLCINRTQMLQKKKENQGVLAKKEVAQLLQKDKPELARIRTEQIIRDDYMIETLEIMEVYFSLLLSRFGLIDAVKVCDPGIREAVCTIIWAAPHLQAEVTEIKLVAAALSKRYGKEFTQQALENTDKGDNTGTGWVSDRIIKKLRCTTPRAAIVTGYLQAIAKTYGIEYNFLEPLPLDVSNGGYSAEMFPDPPADTGLLLPPDNTIGGSNGFNNNNNSGGGGMMYPPSQGHVTNNGPYPGQNSNNGPNIDLLFPSPVSNQQPPPQQQKPLIEFPPDEKPMPPIQMQPIQPTNVTPSAPLDPELMFPPPPTQSQKPPLPNYPPDNKAQYLETQPDNNSYDNPQANPSVDYRDSSNPSDDMYEEINPQNITSINNNSNNNDFPLPPSHSNSGGLGLPEPSLSLPGGGGVGQESEVPDFDELLRRFHDLKTEENGNPPPPADE